MSVGQGAFIGSVFFAVFFTALVAQIWYTLTGKAARPADHRFMSVNRLQAILKHVLIMVLIKNSYIKLSTEYYYKAMIAPLNAPETHLLEK